MLLSQAFANLPATPGAGLASKVEVPPDRTFRRPRPKRTPNDREYT